MYQLLKRLWVCFEVGAKRRYALLFLILTIASALEMVSVLAVMPFIRGIVSPYWLESNAILNKYFFDWLPVGFDRRLGLTLIFASISILAFLVRFTGYSYSMRLAFSSAKQIGVAIYQKTLEQPYSIHLGRNSSEIIGALSKVDEVVFYEIIPCVNLVSSLLIAIGVSVVIVAFLPLIPIMVTLGLGGVYLIFAKVNKKTISHNSVIISRNTNKIVQTMQESLGSIRDIIVNDSYHYFINKYKSLQSELRESQRVTQTLSVLPRYFIEMLGMLSVAIMALYMSKTEAPTESILGILAVFVLCVQKILPVYQLIYSATTTMRGARQSLVDVLELLSQRSSTSEKKNSEEMKFSECLELRNVCFGYPGKNLVLKNINLVIKKGERIGLIGSTGSGKSTLADIMMGLLIPTSGKILVDGIEIKNENLKSWQMNVSHVPQNVSLIDGTIEENIAFAEDVLEIDCFRIEEVCKLSRISEFIESLSSKYKTVVGEDGAQLSGGQKQRIGIARALYRRSSFLVFDESTSALDNATENLLMESINGLSESNTIVMIAHRTSVLEGFMHIYNLDQINSV